MDRPRSGRPPTGTCALAPHLHRLGDAAPLQYGAIQSQGSGRALAPVLARATGVQLGRDSVRGVLKKTRSATAVPRDGLIPPRLLSPLALWLSPPWSPRHAEVSASCSLKTKRSCGALPCPGWAGGAAPRGYRLPTRPLRQGQISQEDRRKWQAWVPYRSWSRITRGVLLNVIGAVPYGTTQVCYQSVPPCDAQELRPYLPPSRDGSLQQNGPSSGAGRRPQWEPPGA